MHMLIRALVYSQDEEDALTDAKEIFERLTDDQDPFDYFTTFDQDGKGVSGKDRWENVPVVARADSDQGKKLVEEGMQATLEEARANLLRIRHGLAHLTDEEIIEGVTKGVETPGLFLTRLSPVTGQEVTIEERMCLSATMLRHTMSKMGEYNGPSIWLYDHDGMGILDRGFLQNTLDKWEPQDTLRRIGGGKAEYPYDGLEVWVVPADVHY